MGSRSVLVCLLLLTSVATGQSVQSTTPSVDSVQELRRELQEVKSTLSAMPACRSDGGGVVAQLVQQLFAMNDKLHEVENKQRLTETRLEAQLNTTRTQVEAAMSQLNTTRTQLEAAMSQLNTTRTQLEAVNSQLNAAVANLGSQITGLSPSTATTGQGSSFIRWGRKSCPNNTALVYAGVAGGKNYNHKGGAANRLCLTKSPQFDNTTKPASFGFLYGAEYESIPGHHDHDVPCSVCLAPQSTTIMVPATLSCPPEWTPQYSGHLASQHYSHDGGEFVCLDGSLEDDSSGVRDDNGLLFYYVVTVCGSLPCPPYINDRVVTCVVCSK